MSLSLVSFEVFFAGKNHVGEVVVFVNKEVNLLLHLGTLLAQES